MSDWHWKVEGSLKVEVRTLDGQGRVSLIGGPGSTEPCTVPCAQLKLNAWLLNVAKTVGMAKYN